MATSSPSGCSACDWAHAAKQSSKASASIRPKIRRDYRENAPVKIQKLGEPIRLALPVENDVLVALGASDCRADGNYQDISERIDDFPLFPWVIEIGKAAGKHFRRLKQAEQKQAEQGKSKPLGLSRDIRPRSLHTNLMRLPWVEVAPTETEKAALNVEEGSKRQTARNRFKYPSHKACSS